MRHVTVMFFCTTNTARSQMAEGLLSQYSEGKFDIYSGGLQTRDTNPHTNMVMSEIGIDMTNWKPRQATEFLGKDVYSYAITLCDRAEEGCPTVFPGVINDLYWPVEDPEAFQGSEEATLTKYREVRDELAQRLQAWLREPKVQAIINS